MTSLQSLSAYPWREPRFDCDFGVAITDDCGRELLARVGNSSEGGFMAECEEKLQIGQHIRAILPDRGEVLAEVRWALGWQFGAKLI